MYSAKSKSTIASPAKPANARKGQLVFLKKDGTKLERRDLYLVTETNDEDETVLICKLPSALSGTVPVHFQPHNITYKVKQTDIFLSPNQPVKAEIVEEYELYDGHHHQDYRVREGDQIPRKTKKEKHFPYEHEDDDDLWYHDVHDQGQEHPQQYPNNQEQDEDRLRPQNHGTDDFDSEENRHVDDDQPSSEENDELGKEENEDVDDDQQEEDGDGRSSDQYGDIDNNQPDNRDSSETDYNGTEVTDPAGAAKVGRQHYVDETPPRPPRGAPAIPAPPRLSRDIPGRLLTHGDLIRYFTGYVNTETQEEIWSTAVVIQMEMSLQRRYPNHYNVANEDGTNCCLELLPGTKWEVRRNNTWETY